MVTWKFEKMRCRWSLDGAICGCLSLVLVQQILLSVERLFARYSKSFLCCWDESFSECVCSCPCDVRWLQITFQWGLNYICLPPISMCLVCPGFLGVMKNTCYAQLHKNVFLLEAGEFSSGESYQEEDESCPSVHIWFCLAFLFFYDHTVMI